MIKYTNIEYISTLKIISDTFFSNHLASTGLNLGLQCVLVDIEQSENIANAQDLCIIIQYNII